MMLATQIAVRLTAAIALTLGATVALAKDGVQDPTVKARMELMSSIGMHTKVLGDMAGGKAPFDAAAALAAKDGLVAASSQIAARFEPEAEDPVSEAMPDVWLLWEDFVVKAETLNKAAMAVDVASADTIKAGMAGIGGACQDCHSTFRMKK